MNLAFLIFSCICFVLLRAIHGKERGVLYTAMRQRSSNRNGIEVDKRLSQAYENIHFVETPFWFCVYFGYGAALYLRLNDIVAAVLISQGCSAIAGVFYQGYVNLGCTDINGVPLRFIDRNEKKYMELAFPIINYKTKINRFWRGRFRIVTSILGLASVIIGIYFIYDRI